MIVIKNIASKKILNYQNIKVLNNSYMILVNITNLNLYNSKILYDIK
jgi:hypothetical protein